MRKLLIPAAAAVVLATSGLALAATAMHATGTVKTVDMKGMMLTLDDGKEYVLPPKFKTALKTGQKVNVTYEMSEKSASIHACSSARSVRPRPGPAARPIPCRSAPLTGRTGRVQPASAASIPR